MHEEITARKKISELLESFESFEQLRGMCLLFNKDSEYYKFSGFVTAALLDYDRDKKISILAIDTKRPKEWFTFHSTREDLIKMFNSCDAVIGLTPETSFLIEKEETLPFMCPQCHGMHKDGIRWYDGIESKYCNKCVESWNRPNENVN